ncbi:hypothetical protein M8J77_004229 [Diaphorina citri]|nr:hypothetical protein M8J77_004229 [Diaphorina citri]
MMLRNAEDCHPIKNVRKLAIAMDARSTCAPDLASAMMTLHFTNLATDTPDQVLLIVFVLMRYQVDLTDGPLQPYLSGLPDSERPAEESMDGFVRR